MKKVTVILSFYKRIDYLKLVLAGFEQQLFKDFEIIIADDGSPTEITNQIELLASDLSLSIKHTWHEDLGFRKNRILNQAICMSDSDYLIFIDGDCVPHEAFVGEHYNNRSEKLCLTGRRVNLSEKITNELTPKMIQKGYLDNVVNLLRDGIWGKSYDVEKGFYFKNRFIRRFFNKKRRGILGCNFSLFKSDMLSINGFDERYEAPSVGEDSDIQYRLELNNIQIKSLNNIAIQYHLYHKLQPRPIENLELFERVKTSGESFTRYGIKK